eukprot:TRINITY_DN8270_c0_g1_i1.p1 TRINITY_DN8270_c0_g1~~TRINITY_DN8270_c0_g1_i1.p1  ORF type:complete len:306 (-),score=93.03 TRINITY_DN8270_c0_g1_i1:22-939(-)
MAILNLLTIGVALSAVGIVLWREMPGSYMQLWRRDIETALSGVDRFSGAYAPITVSSGELKVMWATPIYTVNLYTAPLHANFNVTALNNNLTDMVLEEWSKFMHRTPGTTNSGSDPNSANELFFAAQKKDFETSGKTSLDGYPQFTLFKSIFLAAASTYFGALGQGDLTELPKTHSIFCWATYQQNCMSHLPHTHPYQLISGVYYSKVPEGAGSIVFEDPRGPLPPFENRIIYHPKEGDLIVFPSWLLHQVTPTQGKDVRVSFSCNIPGEWDRTTDVSLAFPVNVRQPETAHEEENEDDDDQHDD